MHVTITNEKKRIRIVKSEKGILECWDGEKGSVV